MRHPTRFPAAVILPLAGLGAFRAATHAAGPLTVLALFPMSIVRWPIAVIGFATGLVGVLLLAVVEYAAWALLVPPRARNVTPTETEDDGVPIQAVAADGARLAGRLYAPSGEFRAGRMALFLHGFAESADTLREIRAAVLRRTGWHVVVLDLRGYGASGGPYTSFGGRESSDVGAWLNVLESRSGSGQPLTFLLWGRSMGAAIALRASAGDSRVRALILESPMLDLEAALVVWFRKRRFPLPGLLARLVTRRASRLAGVSVSRPRAVEVAAHVRCPVLVLQGGDDRLVSPAKVRDFSHRFQKPAHFVEVPGAGHSDVLEVGGEALVDQVERFLLESV